MHHVTRSALFLATLLVLPLRGEPEMQSEYKQSDTNYYLRNDVFQADPAAIVLGPDTATNIGGSYLVTTRPNPPAFVYLVQSHDWIEPITPPSEPASLNIATDAMQVREPQGSVQVALPSAPSDFRDVARGMTLPNGAVLRTGDNGSVAVLFGGVDSVRLAPNTQAAVQLSVTPGKRDAEVDIRGGMVFSKVGQRVGEKETYAVHTPFGIASAHGTDYVTVVYPQRVDVWVASGTVELAAPGGQKQVTISSGHEPLKVMRNPVAPDAATALTESSESLTALLNFIPLANQKLKALADRTRSGAHLTPTERDYVGRIRKVASLIKLATKAAPPSLAAAPAPVAKPAVAAAAPAGKPAPRALPVIPEPATPPPAPATVVKAATTAAAKAVVMAKPAPPKAKPVAAAPAFKKSPIKPVVIVLPPYTPPKLKPVVESPELTTSTPPPKKMAATKTPKPAAATVATAKTHPKAEPVAEEHYLRAKPVDPADLAAVPAVRNLPPTKAHVSDDTADPNSLGAPANPLKMMIAPRKTDLDLRSDSGAGAEAIAKPAATVP